MIILRAGGQTFEIRCEGVTYQTFRSLQQTAQLQAQLDDLLQLIVKESANGPSLELRRLREKAGRLERRIAEHS